MVYFVEIVAEIFEFWHKCISPFMPSLCRHEPTCSIYASQALRKHGLVKGLYLTLHRLSRCHPWGSHGFDPIP